MRDYWDVQLDDPEPGPYLAVLGAALAPGEVRGGRVLDLGCGTGLSSRLLAELGAERVVGVDLSHRWLAFAREHSRGQAIDFVQMDLMHAPALGRFDVVFAYAVLYYAPDPDAAIAAAAACVEHGGLFIVGLLEDNPAARIMNRTRHVLALTPPALRAAVGSVAAAIAWPLVLARGSRPAWTPFRRRVGAGLFVPARTLYSAAAATALVESLGFAVERVARGSGTLAASRHIVVRARRPS